MSHGSTDLRGYVAERPIAAGWLSRDQWQVTEWYGRPAFQEKHFGAV